MTTTAEYIDQIIAAGLALADTNATAANTAANNIIDEASGYYSHQWHPATLPVPVSEEPAIPEVESGLFTFEAQRDNVIGLLADQYAQYLTTYYPLASDAFDEATAWMINVITNGGTGIPAAIENQIWQRARDNLITEGRSVSDQIINGSAARGMPLIDGYSTRALRMVNFKRLEESGKQTTTISVKQAEIEIESIKFAVDAAIRSRTMALNSVGDYIRDLVGGMNSAIQVAQLNPNAKATMMNAVSNLYRARLTKDELIINSNVTARGQNEKYFVDKDNSHWKGIESKVQAAASAAEVFGGVAKSALSSLNTIAQTSTSAFS